MTTDISMPTTDPRRKCHVQYACGKMSPALPMIEARKLALRMIRASRPGKPHGISVHLALS